MGIDWRTALERMHHSDVSEAKRWGMSDEVSNLLRDIITERVTELEAENARLKAERLITDRRIRAQRAELRKNWEIVEQRVGFSATLRRFRMLQDRWRDLRATQAENARIRVALHDAIRRPLGVTPDSALEFYDQRMADEAEKRRSKGSER